MLFLIEKIFSLYLFRLRFPFRYDLDKSLFPHPAFNLTCFFVIIFANALFGFYVVKIAFGFLFVFIWFNISIQKRCSWPFSTNFQPAEGWI